MAKCTDCKQEYKLEDLRYPPHVEEHIRALSAEKETGTISMEDMHTLLCPECYAKRYQLPTT